MPGARVVLTGPVGRYQWAPLCRGGKRVGERPRNPGRWSCEDPGAQARFPGAQALCSPVAWGREGGRAGAPGTRAGLGRRPGRSIGGSELGGGQGWWGRGLTPAGARPLGLEGGREPVKVPTALSGRWEVGAKLLPGPRLCGLTHRKSRAQGWAGMGPRSPTRLTTQMPGCGGAASEPCWKHRLRGLCGSPRSHPLLGARCSDTPGCHRATLPGSRLSGKLEPWVRLSCTG